MPRRPQDADESKRIAKSLGLRVRSYRKDRGWTQSELSDLLGISTEAFGRIERGHALPSFPTFLRLCRILQASPDALLGACEQVAELTAPKTNGNHEKLVRDINALGSSEVDALQRVVEVMLRRTAGGGLGAA